MVILRLSWQPIFDRQRDEAFEVTCIVRNDRGPMGNRGGGNERIGFPGRAPQPALLVSNDSVCVGARAIEIQNVNKLEELNQPGAVLIRTG